MLEQAAGQQDPSRIPGASWDETYQVWRVPAARYHDVVVRMPDAQPRTPDNAHGIQLPSPELRWYQQEALDRWRAMGCRGVIALPTGAGKTRVAIAAIAALGVPALVLVPTRVLLDQWTRALEQAWPEDVGRPIGMLGDGEHRVESITVSTYASAVAWAPRIGDRFGLAIVDEAHHVGAWCPGEVLEMLTASARMGLTATPPPPNGELERRIGRVVYALGVDTLAGDALAAYDVVGIPIALSRGERERYRRQRGLFAHIYAKHARRSGEPFGWRTFVAAASRSPEVRDALAAWRDYRAVVAYPIGKREALRELLARHAGARTLVFTPDNATAYQIAREFLVVPITHEIKRAERAAALARFAICEISVLVSSQVLDEGVDVPDADVAIIVGGTASARRYVQRIGRVLRPREGKRAVVYELVVADTMEVEYVRRRRGGLDVPLIHDDDGDGGDAAAEVVS